MMSPCDAPQEGEQSDCYQAPPHGLKEWLFIIVLCSTQFFVQGSFGYILIPLRIVGQSFGQGPSEATKTTWHVGGYSLTVGTFILIAGELGDLYGSKRTLILGWSWFGVWSVIGGCSAFTRSPVFFDTARALQGIGPALLLPNALAIAGRTYPPGKKKNMIFSAFAMAAPLGCFTAGVIGSAFANIGCFIIAAIGLWVIPPDYPRNQQAAQFDYIGSGLGVAGLLLLNISWNQAPIDGWSTPYVYVLLIVGFLVLGLFVLQERRAVDPILDISIFSRRVVAVLVTTGLGWSSFGVWFYYLFQFIQHFRHVSPLDSAVRFAPGAISGILAALATPYLMAVVSSGWLMAIACAAFLGGCILQIPVKHQGASASLVNTVINYSIAIGLGIAGTVEAEVSHHGVDLLRGYRAALWTSVGLAVLAFGIAFVYAICTFREQRPSRKSSREHNRELV
ncbi:hypothetical protein CNMCM5793_008729 [Aspergillus hiratsukae]|uniref:Major facilitator superfamily (MFS) profile domain-containing protein n=1 Tax=Aspergillus hiratsukae TaxID=1194566 RepID=A0A8H6P1S6_9EURO|nr:hypothetical protein CNMCM5793_008729 [Aspergillus hiratsukae]